MTTTIYNNLDSVINYLNELDNEELVNLHNVNARENSSDDEIYNNDEDFFETYFSGKVIDAVRAVAYGEYSYTDDYVKFNGYGNLESFNSPDAHIDINEIAQDVLDNTRNYDIELEESFEVEGVFYEGEEEDAKELHSEYVLEMMKDESSDEEVLTFEEWIKDNISAV